jgi:hypothetical protein
MYRTEGVFCCTTVGAAGRLVVTPGAWPWRLKEVEWRSNWMGSAADSLRDVVLRLEYVGCFGFGQLSSRREMGWERLDARWDALDKNEMNGLEAIDLEEEAKADVSCNDEDTLY